MIYFLDCDKCGTEVRVTALETQRYPSTTCPKCGAELVFANHELREGRLIVLFRCWNKECPGCGVPKERLLTRTALKKMSQPESAGQYLCPVCGKITNLTAEEKEGNLRMLDEEAAAEAQAS